MRGFRRTLALLAALFVASACADLDVENLNDPDKERVIVTPADVETLISGQYYTMWYLQASYNSFGMATSVMADQHTSSWGNFMMKDSGVEPRIALRNDPSYSYYGNISRAWNYAYRTISAVRDGLIAIAGPDGSMGTEDDMRIGAAGADTHRAVTFAKFLQGLGHYYLALIYDEAFIVDETIDVTQDIQKSPYTQVRDAAIGYFEETIDLCGQGAFSIPTGWVGSAVIDEQRLIRLSHFYIAQLMAYTPRTAAERDAVDWDATDGVLYHLNNGLDEDYILIADNETWWNSYKRYAERSGWSATDLRMLGPGDQKGLGDPDGSWVDWEQKAAGLRLPFDIDADDHRFPSYPPEDTATYGCPGQLRSNSCGGQEGRMILEKRHPDQAGFSPDRGTYHFSGYYGIPSYFYWDDYLGPMLAHSLVEQDLLKAEAYIRTSQPALAVPLINATREAVGGLVAVTGAGPVPEDAPGRCTPRMITNFPDGTWQCGDLLEALKWEKRFETYTTTAGLAWFDDRGWGDLVEGTATMFPVPAQELLLLLEEIYTFGGNPGEIGSAPDIVAWGDGGLRPLNLGDVLSGADIRARVELFEAWRALDVNEARSEPLRR